MLLAVPAATGYAEAAERIRAWTAAGARVAAVLVEADEGVLVARRCGLDVPVLDGVPVARAAGAELVAVEVAGPGRPLGVLTDPLRLRALADGIEPAAASAVARSLADAGSAAVAVRVVVPGGGGWGDGASGDGGGTGGHGRPDRDDTDHGGAWVLDREGGRHGLAEAVAAVRAAAPGWARQVALPGRAPAPVEDLWVADLDAAAAEVEARRGTDLSHGLVVAGLAPHDEVAAAATREALTRALGVPVVVAPGETAAARAGALSTPGAAPDAVVLDLGGGTVDAVAPGGTDVVVAGAGDMVTSAIAAVLGLPRGAADWVKRGPCARREGPHLLLGEDGSRTFSAVPAPAEAVGALVAPGPAGWLPFSRSLAPAEWRALRLHLKRVTLGENVARCLRLLAERTGAVREVVLVGGAAGDAEVLRVLDRAVPGALVGRADVAGGLVAGSLGHRWAVAYGMTLEIDR